MPAAIPLAFNRQFDPRTGEVVPTAPGIARLTAPNASAYTFTGTNSYIVGTDRLFVVDPGPDDDRHLEALVDAVGGRPIEAVLLTHTHRDHSALSKRLAKALAAPLWLPGPHRVGHPGVETAPIEGAENWQSVPGRRLDAGERLTLGDMTIEVIPTPGHCANHVAFGIVGTPDLVIGDHIMAWSSTLITRDGTLRDYFGSLDRVMALPYRRYHPGHGGPVADGPAHARALRAHRQWRNGEIVGAVERGKATIEQLVSALYPKIRPPLDGAARATVEAHVAYLAEEGRLRIDGAGILKSVESSAVSGFDPSP